MTELAVDRPVERTDGDFTLIPRGITVTARVDLSQESRIVVCPSGEGTQWKTTVRTGDPVELYWVGGHEELTLKATIVSIEIDEDVAPRWHLAVSGPAERSQRRKAVRGRVELPVVLL